ncbi:MAG: methionyl-tRNA formyltransferase [Firmicutes bacterium]|nr:methionyl-tRNA formyltransferase [Bacillota bacterium]
MGTPQFAVPSLRSLVDGGWEIKAVVTQPDRPRGRGHRVSFSPIKEAALEAGLMVLQPDKVSEESFIEFLRELEPDAIVVVAFGQLIPPAILELPRYGCINVHASLLPRYRGASPIQQAIIDGCTVTGVTTMLLDEGWDTGDILLQKQVAIEPHDTAGTLEIKLAEEGAKLLCETLRRLAIGDLEPTPQDESQATYAYRLKKAVGEISWWAGARQVVNLIRGVNPWPGAYTYHRGQMLKVWEAAALDREGDGAEPGTILGVGEDGIIVACGAGSVSLQIVQPPNRPRMGGLDYANGYRVEPGEILGGAPSDA